MTHENSRGRREMYSVTESELQKNYEAKKRFIFENLARNIFPSVLNTGKIPRKIPTRPASILSPLVTSEYKRLISEELEFNLDRSKTTSSEENQKITDFIINGIKKTYREISIKDHMLKKYGWKRIEITLKEYWSDNCLSKLKEGGNESIALKKAEDVLKFIEAHPELNVCETARKLGISEPTLRRYRNNFQLDKETGMAIKIKGN